MTMNNPDESLNEDVVDCLQGLVSINIDSEKGFLEAARHTKDAPLQSFFEEMSAIRHRNAEELREWVLQAGGDVDIHGSAAAQIHRWWIDAKQALTGGDPASALNEAERGEDSLRDEYEKAMDQTNGHAAHDLIERQYEAVRQGHDQVKALRERYRNPRG